MKVSKNGYALERKEKEQIEENKALRCLELDLTSREVGWLSIEPCEGESKGKMAKRG